MPIKIGAFATQEGSSKDDVKTSIMSGVAYFGGVGNDYISANSTGTVNLDQKTWFVPALLSGGSGDDEYAIGPGSSCFIADAYTSSNDKLRIYDYSRNIDEFFSVEGRHLFASTTWGTNILIIDAFDSRGSVETISFSDISFSGAAESLNLLLRTFQTRQDQTIEQLMALGELNPRTMGIQSADELRSLMQPVYSYNAINAYAAARNAGSLSGAVLNKKVQDFQFYNLGGGRYGIQEKGKTAIDEITGINTLSFVDKSISVEADIKGVFDQITGKETQDSQVYRLYNAAFARLPDADGLRYWINEYTKKISEYKTIAQSFLDSEEFKTRYGADNTNADFINNMYKNILGRLPDADGLNYWVSNLDTGRDSRVNVLGGFSESAENKTLFSQITGFA